MKVGAALVVNCAADMATKVYVTHTAISYERQRWFQIRLAIGCNRNVSLEDGVDGAIAKSENTIPTHTAPGYPQIYMDRRVGLKGHESLRTGK